ncbi:MAG: lipoyl synthase [Planctomycetes bacterium]|nr:lipoyl synthase [Planctomycetota bacterium]
MPSTPRPPRQRRRSLPDWFKKPLPAGGATTAVRSLVDGLGLHTVCESAKCPNLNECWSRKTATFMVLGNNCTRRCFFCSVPKSTPDPVDPDEPRRVAEAARRLGLAHVVVTSVDRDDLADKGAGHFVAVVRELRAAGDFVVEVLTPDFKGRPEGADEVASAGPDIFNHNIETVPRLYKAVRPGADYRGSLALLARAKRPGVLTKSGLMVGLGEEPSEVLDVLGDLRESGVDIATIGQYLRPSDRELPVARYVPPAEFQEIAAKGRAMGFLGVYAGPFVRSSYNAGAVYAAIRR